MNLSDIGEDELIRRATALCPQPRGRGHGPGNDCAVVATGAEELLLLKTDALVEHVHYASGENAHRIGWKAIARVASDFAAMGGRPAEYLVTLALPTSTPVAWVEDLYRGMASCMRDHGGLLAGGETSSVPEGSARVLSITGAGRVRKEHLVLRSGGNPGDLLLVTGTLGGSLAGKHLDFAPRIEQARWLAGHFRPSAMMDISDGLAKDLPRLAEASGCGFSLARDEIPCTPGCSPEQALNDGEDFELLMAMPPESWPALSRQWRTRFPDLPLTRIGSLVPHGQGEILHGGWEHFSSGHEQTSG